MERSTTDGNRIIRSWKHQAVLKLPERTTGYICYRFNGGTWRIRVRDLHMEEFREFKLNLSLQATYVAFVSEAGEEIRLEIVESSIPVNDPRYAHLPTY